MLFIKKVNKSGIASLILPLSIAVALSSCALLPKEEAVLAPPLQQPEVVNYDTEPIKRGTIEKKIKVLGNFVSVSQSDLFFKYRGGRLKGIYVKTGDTVKPGDLIADLDTDSLASQIRQQELNLKRAQINYERLKNDNSNGSESPDIAIANIQLDDLQRQYDRIKAAEESLSPGMRIQDIFPGSDLDSLKSQIEQKKLSIVKAVENLKKDLESAELTVESETLKLNDLKMEMGKSKLVAESEGVIVYVDTRINQGDSIAAYKLIAKVADPKKLQLQYSNGASTSDFKLGMNVDVSISGKSYPGTVVMTPVNVPADADENTKKSIRVAVENLPPEAELGASADITLIQERRENVLIIPKNAVKYFGGKKYVQILEDGIKKERDIETGVETVTDIEVIKGVSENDNIIIR